LSQSSLSTLNITWEIRDFDIETSIFSAPYFSGKINDNDTNIIITKLNYKNGIILSNYETSCINPMYKIEILFNKDNFKFLQYSGDNGNDMLCLVLHEDTIETNDKDGLIWYYSDMDTTYLKTSQIYQIESMRLFTWNNSELLENNRKTSNTYKLEIDDPLSNSYLLQNYKDGNKGNISNSNILIYSKSFGLTINSSYKTYSLTPTGRVSLIGERFVILRCPEIESQLGGSYAYGANSPGLALFKLGVLGIAESRLDFSSINYKEFHPIGKLDKLHFRFETARGDLYDFKGVNHNLLIVIKYFTPSLSEKNQIMYYPLNNNYNPNIIDYMKNQNDILNNEDEDEDEIDFLKKNFNKIYLEKESNYLIDNNEEDDED
jgi:hypothetical protein